MNKIKLSMDTFELVTGHIIEQSNGGTLFHCPKEGLELRGAGADIFKDFLTPMSQKYFVMEVELLEEDSAAIYLDFMKPISKEEYDMRIMFGVLPKITTVVPIDLLWLNSQTIFPERSNGRLKMGVFGKPIELEEIDIFKIKTNPCHHTIDLRIKDMYLTDEEPECLLPPIKLMDELGQWIPKEWEGKVKNREESNHILRELLQKAEQLEDKYSIEDWDAYGGYKKKKLEATGYFHTQFEDKKWWLVDPVGHAFFSTGIDCIRPGTDSRIDVMREFCSWIPKKEEKYKDCFMEGNRKWKVESINYPVANMIEAFGVDGWWEKWAKIVKMYLMEWGINTIGNWSEYEFIKAAKMPYVIPLEEYSAMGFPTTQVTIYRDFPDVFAKEYEENAREYAKALEQFKDDPYLIGYFMRNEPAWAFVYELNIAEEMLANKTKSESKKQFISQLKEKYKTIEEFNKYWNLKLEAFEELYSPIRYACQCSETARKDLISFSKKMITRYVELPAKECRKVDGNHLNLGMRYAFITDPILLSGYENFDVFSINSYQMNPYDQVEGIAQLLNMPVMIGEFHHGALDKGLTATGIKGVANQAERGRAYRYYVEQAAKSKYFLGAHYFMFNDQNCLGRFDGENYQIGLIDLCMQEYKEMADAMKVCHKNIYQVHSGEIQAYETIPVEIPALHY